MEKASVRIADFEANAELAKSAYMRINVDGTISILDAESLPPLSVVESIGILYRESTELQMQVLREEFEKEERERVFEEGRKRQAEWERITGYMSNGRRHPDNPRLGRNERCTCGCGLKVKKCPKRKR